MTEIAGILRILLLGDRQLAQSLKAPVVEPLMSALQMAEKVHPWRGMTVIAGDGDDAIALVGAEPLAKWQRNPTHDAIHETKIELPVRLQFDDGVRLELGPLLRARICEKCDHRDVFLYDTLYDDAADGKFDLIDYGRGPLASG